ncbi:serine/threonine protein kinase [Paraburkholderia guartelaensis]|uniref:non-specific serine/threonine protein kinase n=1 Tax=Paraburkholderia guartelaensis TaxID=2546446 RepID=A0A4R5L7B1_9BURK|nr:serine/threonine-protein kinase [Paraburkholderia guartelaensis]TDG04610.1 serine/threonine protein kinase [Paraburkholderia guartelaensis]
MTESHYAEAAAHAAPPGTDGVRPLPNGHRLAGFELDSVLGKGGFGIVYRAFDRTLQRAVAIKEYMPAMLASRAGDFTVALRAARFSQAFDAGRAAFLNEARLLAQFDHPGLVKVLHFWESHGTAYMVMPFYEGQTLEQLQKRGKQMSEAALRRMLASVLGALDVLHRAQCFHRDISLDNILMLPNGNPVLLDFGAARKLIGDMVDETAMMLKPGYAPIEQYTDDPAFRQGPWTDIYALGALAYALMTGELPPAAVVRSIQDQYRPLAGREAAGHDGEHYGERLRAAIDHALALRIEDRPDSVGAFAQALDLHEVSPSVFVPAGYDAPARAAGIAADVAGASAQDDATHEAPARQGATPAVEAAPAPVDATVTNEGEGAETPPSVEAPSHDGAAPQAQNASPREAAHEQVAPQLAAEVSRETVERHESTVSEASHWKFSWRMLRIPALVLLLILVVGVPVLRFAIHARPVPRQAAASRSAPPAPVSHAPALAQALPGANAPGQSTAQPQQQPGASGLRPAAPAMTTDTTVVEVHAGKDKPVNATDAGVAPAAVQPAQTNAAAQPPAEAQASPAVSDASAPVVAQAPRSSVRTPAPLPPVRVHFQIVPWGEVYVDGVRRGVSPPFRTASLAPGTHRIEIRNGSSKPYVRMVTLDAGSAPLEISHTFE